MHPNNEQLNQRAAYYLCLARALQAPMKEADYLAFRDWLAGDLAAIAADAGYDAPTLHTTELGAAIGEFAGDHISLLRTYSDLFLVPPAKVFLNGGVYLDQTLMGAHTAEMIEFYRHHGVDKSDEFRNLPDHISVQLEFVAYLLLQATTARGNGQDDRVDDALRAARNFIGRYLAPWLPALRKALAREAATDPRYRIYRVLGDILQQAVDNDLAWLDADYAQSGDGPASVTVANVASAEAVREMIDRLKAAGLDTAHLQHGAASGTQAAGNA